MVRNSGFRNPPQRLAQVARTAGCMRMDYESQAQTQRKFSISLRSHSSEVFFVNRNLLRSGETAKP